MSSFKGQMAEYKSIAIDRFDGKNLQCTAFFLSHCHKDHMVGLNQSAFFRHLQSRQDIFLYCTDISRTLLLAEEEYAPLEKHIRTLEVGCHIVNVPKNSSCEVDTMVTVTLIPAGHCPGSVMFLYEGNEGRVLYTGDFRWDVNQAARMSAFRDGRLLKPIKSLYIDTTFCVPQAFHIPSRKECVSATLDLVSDWLRSNASHVVSLSCPAKYGHEHLLAELSRGFGTKIHVPDWKVEVYKQIADLSDVFSDDPNLCRIHACTWKIGVTSGAQLPCGHTASKEAGGTSGKLRILNIRPSVMWFTSDKAQAGTKDLVVAPSSHRGLHRVCYSLHSSYSEIRDLVSFLKPERVFPNVVPSSDTDRTAVQERLEGFLQIPHKERSDSPSRVSVAAEPSFLANYKPLPTARNPYRESYRKSENSSEELVFNSPEKSDVEPKGNGTAMVRLTRQERIENLREDQTKPELSDMGGSPEEKQSNPESSKADGALQSNQSDAESSYANSLPGREEEINLSESDETLNGEDIGGRHRILVDEPNHEEDDVRMLLKEETSDLSMSALSRSKENVNKDKVIDDANHIKSSQNEYDSNHFKVGNDLRIESDECEKRPQARKDMCQNSLIPNDHKNIKTLTSDKDDDDDGNTDMDDSDSEVVPSSQDNDQNRISFISCSDLLVNKNDELNDSSTERTKKFSSCVTSPVILRSKVDEGENEDSTEPRPSTSSGLNDSSKSNVTDFTKLKSTVSGSHSAQILSLSNQQFSNAKDFSFKEMQSDLYANEKKVKEREALPTKETEIDLDGGNDGEVKIGTPFSEMETDKCENIEKIKKQDSPLTKGIDLDTDMSDNSDNDRQSTSDDDSDCVVMESHDMNEPSQQQSDLDRRKKRKVNEVHLKRKASVSHDSEDEGSVEFLYEQTPPKSSRVSEGWLSKATPLGMSQGASSKRKFSKRSQENSSPASNCQPQTIDLTLIDSD